MVADSIRAYVSRDWESVAASKTAYWAERFQQEGWRPAWDAADALLLEMQQIRPDYPDEAARVLDLAAHMRLRHRLDSVADAFTGR